MLTIKRLITNVLFSLNCCQGKYHFIMIIQLDKVIIHIVVKCVQKWLKSLDCELQLLKDQMTDNASAGGRKYC